MDILAVDFFFTGHGWTNSLLKNPLLMIVRKCSTDRRNLNGKLACGRLRFRLARKGGELAVIRRYTDGRTAQI